MLQIVLNGFQLQKVLQLIVALDAPYIHVLPEASKKKTMRLLTHIYTFSGRNESTGIGNDKGMHTLHEE